MSSSTTTTRDLRGVRVFGSRPGLRRHIWTAGELQELCRAYMEHSREMPMWKIAEMLYTTFSYPKHDIIEDEDYVPPRRAPGYAVVPSIAAITSKLMNCVYLETGGELGYMTAKPSELQTQVWEHLLQSRQHHAMIQAMKSSSSSDIAVTISLAAAPVPSTPIKIKREEEDESASCVAPGAPMKPKQQQQQSRVRISIGRVRIRDSDDEEEFKSEQPPTKRRKIIFDDDDEVASEMTPTEMQTYTPTATTARADALQFQFDEVADALSEIEQEISDGDDAPVDTTSAADMMYSGDEDDGYDVYNDAENSYNTHYQQHLQQQHEQQQKEMHAAIMAALNRISEHEQQIGELSSRVSGVHTEIEMIRQAIAEEVATLTGMFNLNPEEVGATDDADADADAMSECDGEYCDHGDQGHYFVDGHQVSSWIYNEEYDEPPRYGDYDHHEECS